MHKLAKRLDYRSFGDVFCAAYFVGLVNVEAGADMSSILVVEGEGLIAELLRATLGREGYQIFVSLNVEDAVRFILREIPELVIIDLMLLSVDGYELIRRLRDHPKSMHIPIIAVNTRSSMAEKVRAYELGADNYITKPFDAEELLAHARRQIRRVQQTSLSPLTHLPGGLQLEHAIEHKMKSSTPWSVLYLDLDNFKAFNDVYGFLAGNGMILLVGRICQRVVYEYGNADDFVGHVGGDDFVIVTTPDREKVLCKQILARYKEESVSLYLKEDVVRGSISGVDRKGRPYQFPLVSLSIGIVSERIRCAHSVAEVGLLAAEAKRHAKQSSNNISHLSPQWNRKDYPHSPHASSVNRCIPHLGHNLLYFVEEDALAEYKI
ncbi:MAG TPA: response regulator [Ktedonobacteraceae bacterium]|nr:response regulator [Ktedonobacteraceae bacterium]